MSFISLLLQWYYTHKRDLPWRSEKNVYHVWLSEIILQQTRVNQGLGYYTRFVETYPTVSDLANASEQEVLNLWQGLGYYSRARNLHKTAKYVHSELNNEFPTTFAELKKLAGIGPYTAAAIASICFDERVPAIDGNAYRVYSRLYGIDKDISDSNAHKFFFDFIQERMPKTNSGDINEAIMELGATICLPKNPYCYDCPISNHCRAYQTGTIHKYPVKTKKVKIRKRYFHYFFIHNSLEQFIIKKRTEKDVWFNLNDFPLIETSKNQSPDISFLNIKPVLVSDYKHILTHQRIDIKIYEAQVSDRELNKICSTFDGKIVEVADIVNIPFPKPIFNFLHTRYPNREQS